MAAILFILVKGNLMRQFGMKIVDLDLVVILIGCLLAGNGRTGSAVFAMAMGVFTDTFSAGLPGLSALLYMAVFLTIHMGSRVFDPHVPRGLFILVSMAVCVKAFLFSGLLYAFAMKMVITSSDLAPLGLSALVTGFLAPPALYALNSLRRPFMKEKA
ncbi:MAG: hypothetical protein JXL84_06490 [Deltaproteobacteria bacterium]|nr:hypothetical protein [Deltaproteobacteria bacterium]